VATLADSYTNAAGLRTALRDAVGHPDQTVLLPDRTVDNACQRALDRLNADRPTITVATFATVASQQAYTPLPAAAYGFRRVYWPLTECETSWSQWQGLLGQLSPFLPLVPDILDESGTVSPAEPAEGVAVLRQHQWMRKLRGGGASFVERAVYLDPVPASVRTVVYTYHGPRYASFLTVADGDRQRFLDLAEHFLHARLAVGAGAVTDVQDDNEGTSISTDAAAQHDKAARYSLRSYRENRSIIIPSNAFP
jgi:hypothetical protein